MGKNEKEKEFYLDMAKRLSEIAIESISFYFDQKNKKK